MSQYKMCEFFLGICGKKLMGVMFGLWSKMLCLVAVRVGNVRGGVGVRRKSQLLEKVVQEAIGGGIAA